MNFREKTHVQFAKWRQKLFHKRLNMKPNLLQCALVPTLLISLLQLTLSAHVERSSRPAFNKENDLFIAQFDGRPDADDIHSQAALGCLLIHPDFDDVNVYGVMNAYGSQGYSLIWDSRQLMTRIFGAEGPTTWTDAYREGGDLSRYTQSVQRIVNLVTPILQNGGHVWVQEAGQSDITRDWIQDIIEASNGLSEFDTRNRVHVVQHSSWNHDHTSSDDRDYVINNADYIRIDDGNYNNLTPDYHVDNTQFLTSALNTSNPNKAAWEFWTKADALIGSWGEFYSAIGKGGVDFSDCSENWWIFDLGDRANTVESFWERYVTNSDSATLEDINETYHVESDGVVVMDIESVSTNSYWKNETQISGYLGQSYFTAQLDSFPNPGIGIIEFPIYIENSGVYQFQMRSRITVGNDYTEHNDTWVRLVDNIGYHINPVPNENDAVHDWYKAYQNQTNQWVWDAKNKDNAPKSLAWSLEGGKAYRLQISTRSYGHAIDRLLLWNRSSGYPSYGNSHSGDGYNTADSLQLSEIKNGEDLSIANPHDPKSIPSKVQAEEFSNMNGIQTENTSDDGGGSNVGYIDSGDWMEYILTVTEAGEYDITFRVASLSNGVSFNFLQDSEVLDTINHPATGGWQNWESVTRRIALSSGVSTLKIEATGSSWNINWMDFNYVGSVTNHAPTVAFIQPAENITIQEGTPLNVEIDAQDIDGNGTIAQVELTLSKEGSQLNSYSDSSSPYSFSLEGLTPGLYTLETKAIDIEGLYSETLTQNFTVEATNVALQIIPGKIEAEDFTDNYGVLTENAMDDGGTLNVGWMDFGDWLTYRVNVEKTGFYSVLFRVASKGQPTHFDLLNGSEVLTTVYEPETGGWQNWTTVKKSIYLNAGESTLEIQALGPAWNLNWMNFADVESAPELQPNWNRLEAEGSFDLQGNVIEPIYASTTGLSLNRIECSQEKAVLLQENQSLTFTTQNDSSDSVDCIIRLANFDFDAYSDLELIVDGASFAIISLEGTGWTTVLLKDIPVFTGSATFELIPKGNTNGVEIDYMDIKFNNSLVVIPEFTLTDDITLEGEQIKNQNFLKVENNYRTSYLKFNIDQPSYVNEAFLYLHVDGAGSESGGDGIVHVYLNTQTDWSESDVSSQSLPSKDSYLGYHDGAKSKGEIMKIPLHGLNIENSTFTLIIEMGVGNDFWFSSKEGSTAPRLDHN